MCSPAKYIPFHPRTELTPIRGDRFAIVERSTSALNLARPCLIHALTIVIVETLEQACRDLRALVLGYSSATVRTFLAISIAPS